MHTSITSAALLLSTLTALILVPGCDEAYDEDLPDGEEVTERCFGAGCSSGPIGNTSKIGDHALSNMAVALGQAANNPSASVKVTGGTGYLAGSSSPLPITAIAVEDDGELRLQLSTAGWIGGTTVKNAWLNLQVTPSDSSKPAFTGRLLIDDVFCEPGHEDSTMTICRYEFVTNVVPADPANYPMSTKHFGYYHTCPMEDEGGALSGTERYAAVLSPESTLTVPGAGTPKVNATHGYFINGCLNGAVSKGQYHLNAFYDATAYRGLDPSQRIAMLLMWMAWYGGASRTQVGNKIWPHDPIGGLFTWTADPTWDVEAGYSATGATCRGTGPGIAQGLHRNYINPVLTLTGWSALPPCTAATLPSLATLGVKVAKP